MRSVLIRMAIILLASCATAAHGEPRKSTAQPNVHVLAPMRMPGLDRERVVRVYLPPHYESSHKRYPVLYMHDGQNLFDDATSFVGEWNVDETLNELARTRGLELIVVGIDHGGTQRMTELDPWDNEKYGAGEGHAYLDFLVHVVKPYVDAHYRSLPDRAHTAIMGSSLGGLISHYAIYEYNDVFGAAGIFSPAYWFAPPVFEFTRTHRLRPDTKLYVYAGGKEDESMLPNLEKAVALIRAQGLPANRIEVTTDANAPHNEGAWRAQFARAVIWLFAPQ